MLFCYTGFIVFLWYSAIVYAAALRKQVFKSPSLVQYWGQNSAGATSSGQQQSLASYCDGTTDALVIAFVDRFNLGGQPGLALPCGDNCQEIGKDIKTCQSRGHMILLSLGGASGAYGFQNDQQASQFAETLWNTFGRGGGSSGGDGVSVRPFGDAVVDGFDLDIEGGGSAGYAKLVQELRRLYKTDSTRQYLITAAPQCPFPDATLNEQILQGVDAVFVQFYNNFCSIAGAKFNFDTWDAWASKAGVKVLVGIPGSPKAAGSGYVGIDQLAPAIGKVAGAESFGGIMVWDASQSYSSSTTQSSSFAVALGKLVHQGASSTNNSSSSSIAASSGVPSSSVLSSSPALSSGAPSPDASSLVVASTFWTTSSATASPWTASSATVSFWTPATASTYWTASSAIASSWTPAAGTSTRVISSTVGSLGAPVASTPRLRIG